MIKRNRILFLLIFTILLIVLFTNIKTDQTLEVDKNSSINNGVEVKGLEKIIDLNIVNQNNEFIVLNIWASWCIPCKSEVSELKKISNTEGYLVIGILVEDTIENGEEFIKENYINFQNILDPDNSELIISQFYWSGIPTTILLNKEFEVIQTFNGEITSDEIINFSD
jgi:thiol-disulfide isomerase/thioredoxin